MKGAARFQSRLPPTLRERCKVGVFHLSSSFLFLILLYLLDNKANSTNILFVQIRISVSHGFPGRGLGSFLVFY